MNNNTHDGTDYNISVPFLYTFRINTRYCVLPIDKFQYLC